MISLCLSLCLAIKLDPYSAERGSYVQLFIRIKFDQIFEIKI